MGVCGSRDDFEAKWLDPLSDEEKRIYYEERDFGISKVSYIKYKEAVKKNGSAPELTSDQLAQISKDIQLNMQRLTKEINSIEALTFRDAIFTYHESKSSYLVLELLIIGFLYCSFESEQEHLSELWALINPKPETKATIEQMMDIVSKLFHVSIDQRLAYEKLKDKSSQDSKKLQFLQRCQDNKMVAQKKIHDSFTTETVDKVTFDRIIGERLHRTYQIRSLAVGRLPPQKRLAENTTPDLDAASQSSRMRRQKSKENGGTSPKKQTILFTPHQMGDLKLQNRIVCCSLTRCRANPEDGVPSDLHVEYYSSRASSAFMFTESVPISKEGNGLPGAACLYNDSHEAGWRKVVKAVHEKKGKILLQLWHGGRTCGGMTPISSSDLPLKKEGQDDVKPKAATIEDLNRIKEEFRHSAERGKRAGFDGLELNITCGYFLDSFLRDGINNRTDDYGGSIQKRARYVLEVIDAVIKVWGASRVGIKISPINTYNDNSDKDPVGVVTNLIEQLNERKVGFIEVVEGPAIGMANDITKIKEPFSARFKKKFNGTWIGNFGYTQDSASDHLVKGYVDLVSFGWLYVSNADLVEKFKSGEPLYSVAYIQDMSKFVSLVYYGGPLGYTDLSCYAPPQPLLNTHQMGDLQLPNRIVCCSLTRCRANPQDGVPTDLHAEYYSSRSTSSFMFTESVPISLEASGTPGSACLYTDQQEAGWKKVVKAVHDKGGRIFLQLWHAGRTSDPETIGGLTPISSTDQPFNNDMRKAQGKGDIVPRAATIQDLQRVKEEYSLSAERGKRCGFDGIAINCAYGYFLDSFLRGGLNKRTDQYGGSIENRARYPLEILDTLIKTWGASKVGIKISPINDFNGNSEKDPDGVLDHLVKELNKRKVAFLEVSEGGTIGMANDITKIKNPMNKKFKKKFNGTWIANFGYNQKEGNDSIKNGYADLVSFGWPYVANPDLVEKFKSGATLYSCGNIQDMSKFAELVYYGGPLGYTDLSVYAPPEEQKAKQIVKAQTQPAPKKEYNSTSYNMLDMIKQQEDEANKKKLEEEAKNKQDAAQKQPKKEYNSTSYNMLDMIKKQEEEAIKRKIEEEAKKKEQHKPQEMNDNQPVMRKSMTVDQKMQQAHQKVLISPNTKRQSQPPQ